MNQAPTRFEGRPLADADEPIFDQGLAFDLETVLTRRRLLQVMGYTAGAAGAAAFLAACGASGTPTSAGTTATPLATAGASATAAASATSAATAASCDTVSPRRRAARFRPTASTARTC